jgi:hypothetical protein
MYICTHCGWEGERKSKLRGSKTVEMLIWSILVVPGPFYSVWRRTGKSSACPHCQMPAIVKLSSDAGWLARRKFDVEMGLVTPIKETKKDELSSFGNDKPAETPRIKKPVNPDEW